MGLAITWAMSFLLTEAGAYKYDGCDVNIPTSNMISNHCRSHVARMKSCRADTSHALNSSPWFRFPYPLQWGTPVFNWKMAIVMCVASLITSVDSVRLFQVLKLKTPLVNSFKIKKKTLKFCYNRWGRTMHHRYWWRLGLPRQVS